MKRNKLLIFLVASLPIFIGGLTSCAQADSSNASGSQVLRVLNWEDYIYIQDEEEGYEAEDMVVQFEKYIKENYPEYSNVKVVYDTTDTNETMFNEIQTGKTHYDLICPSDYMIQKLLSLDLLEPLDRSLLPNFQKYVSPYMKEQLDSITVDVKDEKGNLIETKSLKDYAVGYMWGTLGIVFNPEYHTFVDRNIGADKAIYDMQTWSSLWNKDYKGTISVKDSMRDTYAIGVIETYKEELQALRNKYLNHEIDDETYNNGVTEIFNRSEQHQIDEVSKTLSSLKDNVFGLEVDSGKQDIVEGKIGINFAWSGDACYSIELAADEKGIDLLYAVPELGSNIWFDGWCMPKDEARSDAQYELAHLFIDFMSQPVNAAQNVSYIGYTSFVGGDEMLDQTRDWYDIRTEYIYYGEDYDSLYYVDPNNGEEVEVWYDDCHYEVDEDPAYDDVELYYYNELDEAVLINEKYNERLVIDPEWEVVDLSYAFDETLDEYSKEDGDTLFYSDNYLPYYDEENNHNISVGGAFFCQYPDKETMNRCAVMRDFGDNNKLILEMWENFKSDPLPAWATILFAFEIVLIVGFVGYFVFSKYIKHSLRKKRKETK